MASHFFKQDVITPDGKIQVSVAIPTFCRVTHWHAMTDCQNDGSSLRQPRSPSNQMNCKLVAVHGRQKSPRRDQKELDALTNRLLLPIGHAAANSQSFSQKFRVFNMVTTGTKLARRLNSPMLFALPTKPTEPRRGSFCTLCILAFGKSCRASCFACRLLMAK